MAANHPNLASVSYMSAASSDLFFAVQQGLQVSTVHYPKMESVSHMSAVSNMSAASSDLLFIVQQGLQVNTGLYPNMESVGYMSAASSDLFFAVQQGLQVNKFFIPIWSLSATCRLPVQISFSLFSRAFR
jgi:hypothetical protein